MSRCLLAVVIPSGIVMIFITAWILAEFVIKYETYIKTQRKIAESSENT